MRQSAGQLSRPSWLPSSQLSGAVMCPLPQIVQKEVQPSLGFRLPSSHSSPGSWTPLPHDGGVVDVVVEIGLMVVGVTVVVVVDGACPPSKSTVHRACDATSGANGNPERSVSPDSSHGMSLGRTGVPWAQSNCTWTTGPGWIESRAVVTTKLIAVSTSLIMLRLKPEPRRLVTRPRTLPELPVPGMLSDGGYERPNRTPETPPSKPSS